MIWFVLATFLGTLTGGAIAYFVHVKKEPRWMRKVRFWIYDDAPEWLTDILNPRVFRLWCWKFGHIIEQDQCRRPEHDFCVICFRSFPGQA